MHCEIFNDCAAAQQHDALCSLDTPRDEPLLFSCMLKLSRLHCAADSILLIRTGSGYMAGSVTIKGVKRLQLSLDDRFNTLR